MQASSSKEKETIEHDLDENIQSMAPRLDAGEI